MIWEVRLYFITNLIFFILRPIRMIDSIMNCAISIVYSVGLNLICVWIVIICIRNPQRWILLRCLWRDLVFIWRSVQIIVVVSLNIVIRRWRLVVRNIFCRATRRIIVIADWSRPILSWYSIIFIDWSRLMFRNCIGIFADRSRIILNFWTVIIVASRKRLVLNFLIVIVDGYRVFWRIFIILVSWSGFALSFFIIFTHRTRLSVDFSITTHWQRLILISKCQSILSSTDIRTVRFIHHFSRLIIHSHYLWRQIGLFYSLSWRWIISFILNTLWTLSINFCPAWLTWGSELINSSWIIRIAWIDI